MSHTLTAYNGDEGTTLNLADTAATGYHLSRWSPAFPPLSDLRNNSMYADGSRSVFGRSENVTEQIVVEIVGTSRDDMFIKLRALYRLVMNARGYAQSPGLRAPSYISYKPDSVTNTSYAAILGGAIDVPQLDAEILSGEGSEGEMLSNTMPGVVITIEREPFWRDHAPVISQTRTDFATDLSGFANAVPVAQMDTATVVGTIGGLPGTVTVIVTSAYLVGSPITLAVSAAANDTATQVAVKIQSALNGNAVIAAEFTAFQGGPDFNLVDRYVRPNDATLNISIANGTCTGLTAAPTSANTVAAVVGRLAQFQVETATVVGTCTLNGNATVIVTAANLPTSPVTISVALVTSDDSATKVATKIRAAIVANAYTSSRYTVGGAGANVVITERFYLANDATMNISIANGTCTGLTAAPASANTTTGYQGNQSGNVGAWGRTIIPAIPGDIPALTEIRMALRNVAGDALTLDRFVLGYRSYPHSLPDGYYYAYGVQECEGDGVWVTGTLYNSSSFQSDATASPGNGVGNAKVRTSFATTATDVKRNDVRSEFGLAGTNRVFARMRMTGAGSATVHVSYATINLTEVALGLTVTVASQLWRMYDMGIYNMGLSETTLDQSNAYRTLFNLYAARTAGAAELEIDFLFVVPADEYYVSAQGINSASGDASIFRIGNIAPVSQSAQTAYNPPSTDAVGAVPMALSQWAGSMRFPLGYGALYWICGDGNFGNIMNLDYTYRMYIYYTALYLAARGNT